MSTTAVTLPAPGQQLTLDQIEQVELNIAAALPGVDDIPMLQTWLSQASALAAFIKRKDLQAPIMGAQRRIEARIGELLGEADGSAMPEEIKELFPHRTEIHSFRTLARGSSEVELTEEDWRQPRTALVKQVKTQLGEVKAVKPPTAAQQNAIDLVLAVRRLSQASITVTELASDRTIMRLDDAQRMIVREMLAEVAAETAALCRRADPSRD